MKQLPEAHRDVQKTDAGDGSAHPSRRNETLQAVAGLARSQEQEIVVAPVAQTPPAMRHPGQNGEHYANLKA